MNNTIDIFKQVTNWYKSDIHGSLKHEAKKIKKIFNQIIDKNAESYDLVSSNSIHSSNYFSIKKRVKSPDSLLEKFVRKNMGLSLVKSISLDENNFSKKKPEIENYIKKEVDDIIGLRVVCDLKEDCHKILKLIKDKESILNEHKVIFNLIELEDQPQKMRNGLDIYRIKGCYDNRISFELQIKSKIEEAWGELDHFMIYKDYSFFPSKDTVQSTMNNVGHLLDKIEFLLYDLRNTKLEYNKSLKKNNYLTELENLFSEKLKTIFNFEYPLQKLSDVLYSLVDLTKINKQQVDSFNLNFEINEHENEEINNFILSRNESFELKIIEKIYFLSISESSNYENEILNLIEKFQNKINHEIIETNEIYEVDFNDFYKDYYKIFISSKANESLWISSKSIIDAFNDMKNTNILLGDSAEEIVEDEYKNSILEKLKIAIASLNFDCDIKTLLHKMKMLDNNDFKLVTFDLKEKCDRLKDGILNKKQLSKMKSSLIIISNQL